MAWGWDGVARSTEDEIEEVAVYPGKKWRDPRGLRTDRIAGSRCHSFLGPDAAVRPFRSASSLVGAACASNGASISNLLGSVSVALFIRPGDMRPSKALKALL